jgi:hypothetical protein
MLNLTVAMLKAFFIFLITFQTTAVSITSPQTGDTLRGQIEIQGVMDVPNFTSAEIGFSFASDLTDTWFAIQTFSQPIQNSTIAIWDTTSLTDGDYNLRLRVNFQDGTFQDVIVTDLKVRNQELPTPTSTHTPLPQFNDETPTPRIIEPTSVVLSLPSTTPLPMNPASITTNTIYKVFAQSALIVLILFVVISLLLRFRKDA